MSSARIAEHMLSQKGCSGCRENAGPRPAPAGPELRPTCAICKVTTECAIDVVCQNPTAAAWTRHSKPTSILKKANHAVVLPFPRRSLWEAAYSNASRPLGAGLFVPPTPASCCASSFLPAGTLTISRTKEPRHTRSAMAAGGDASSGGGTLVRKAVEGLAIGEPRRVAGVEGCRDRGRGPGLALTSGRRREAAALDDRHHRPHQSAAVMHT